MAFTLCKLPCTVTQVLDIEDCPPNDGTEYFPRDFPVYYDPLYHPENHADLFRSPEHVCEWLQSCFRVESLWSDVSVEFREGLFYVEDVSINMRLRLSPMDIASPCFHPRLSGVMRKCGQRGCNPSWVYASEGDLSDSFDGITLRAMVTFTGKTRSVHTCKDVIGFIVKQFLSFSCSIRIMDDAELKKMCKDRDIENIPMVNQRRYMVFELFRCEFGDVLFPKIIRPRPCLHSYPRMYGNRLLQSIDPELDYTTFRGHVRGISNKMLTDYPTRMHASRHLGCRTDSRNRRLECLRVIMMARWRVLTGLPSAVVADILNCYDAIVELKSTFSVLIVMEREFGSSICNIVLPPIHDRYRRVARQSVRRIARDASDESLAEHFEQVAAEWPQVVPLDSKLECARQYLQGTKWPKVFTCSVCARELNHGDVLPVNHYSEGDIPMMALNLHFNLLIASDGEWPDAVDIIDHPLLSKYMLEPKGYVNGILHMCTECESELIKGQLPMFALRNGLYRGHLLERFRDLTWVEEMACAIYRCTCHVTRLYNTPNDDQPKVFKGNTCAHDLNYVSTAAELPRPPADVKGMLSIVFVGPKQSMKSCLRKFNYVRKAKVWDFLRWLAENNPMYSKIRLSQEHLALYENDEIPGLEARVTDFEMADTEEMFQEETAGFAPHFALDNELTNIDSGILDEPLLERMGVSDIESVNIQGRTFQASALKNLIRPPGKKPDLLAFCGEDAIGEYSNPRLMMGMFPTLYPYGKGGFEDSV
ncbi:uncharacterized protein ARMOST_14911 [Armillaria ostoyae]|uniref:DUF6570 domain-containing protein n=1 Tax=Armillaria ostoyae TaxID=47428 RepID=A0A284RRW2_ARMOS|nr:uncharacterized protein ARMOST_14911 [Armillaria ostoyae]